MYVVTGGVLLFVVFMTYTHWRIRRVQREAPMAREVCEHQSLNSMDSQCLDCGTVFRSS